MQIHISLLHKVWDRGVDIAVAVLTSLIIAGLGLLSWRVKLRLDLHADEQRQLQQHRVASEIEAERKREEAELARDQRKFELEQLARGVEEAKDVHTQALIWERFERFVTTNDLAHRPENLPSTEERSVFSAIMRSTGHMLGIPPQRPDEMATLIRKTVLNEAARAADATRDRV